MTFRQRLSTVLGAIAIAIGLWLLFAPAGTINLCNDGGILSPGSSQCAGAHDVQTLGGVLFWLGILVVVAALVVWRRAVAAPGRLVQASGRPPAGWYPHPTEAGLVRWWTGEAWGPLAPSTRQDPPTSEGS